jgi:hypothetical protein
MGNDTQTLAIPQAVQDGLDELTKSLADTLADSLVSVLVYGDVAKGEGFQLGHGVVNVAIFLDSVSIEKLDKVATAINKAIKQIRLAPLILSEDDLRTSTDVFPIKFLGMQEHHQVLHGKDVLQGLTISRDHLRLRCEQQVKNLHLRLNAAYVRQSSDARALRLTLEDGIVALVADLGTMLLLKSGSSPTLHVEIVEAAAPLFGLNSNLLEELLWLRRSDDKVQIAELKALYSGFMDAVQHAAQQVDEM